MKRRTANKVFLRACQDWTGHKHSTLAKAATKVTGHQITASVAFTLFTLMWAPQRWPTLGKMFEDWLSVKDRADHGNLLDFLGVNL
jgi:hypothetical protein